jgi:hypothetical protein
MGDVAFLFFFDAREGNENNGFGVSHRKEIHVPLDRKTAPVGLTFASRWNGVNIAETAPAQAEEWC